MEMPEIVGCGIFDTRETDKNGSMSPWRETNRFEIELSAEEGGVLHIGDGVYPVVRDMIVCAKPGQRRHAVYPYRCYYVHVVLHEGELYDALTEIPDCFITGKEDVYRSLFVKLLNHRHSFSEDARLLMQSRLLELIYTLRTDAAWLGGAHAADRQSLIDDTLDYVEAHLTEDLTLEKVAKAMSFSPIYFHNVFRAAMGKTLRQYVEEQRLRRAIYLLTTTGDSLTKIAFECGFSSQSYFSYVFKRRMGLTPREYVRESYKEYEG